MSRSPLASRAMRGIFNVTTPRFIRPTLTSFLLRHVHLSSLQERTAAHRYFETTRPIQSTCHNSRHLDHPFRCTFQSQCFDVVVWICGFQIYAAFDTENQLRKDCCPFFAARSPLIRICKIARWIPRSNPVLFPDQSLRKLKGVCPFEVNKVLISYSKPCIAS